MRFLIETSRKFELIGSIFRAIDSAKSKWQRFPDGSLFEVANLEFRKSPSGHIIDRRLSFEPEIKSAGYDCIDENKFELFHHTKKGTVILEDGYIGKKCTIATVHAPDPTARAVIAEWFLGRVLYHFSNEIERIEIREINTD